MRRRLAALVAARRTTLREWTRVLLVASIVGAVMSVSGSFGSGSLVGRLLYGEMMTLLGVGLGFAGRSLVIPKPWFETRRVLAASVMIVVVGLPMTLLADVTGSASLAAAFSLTRLGQVFPTTLATTAGITALAFMVHVRETTQTHVSPRGETSRFLARMPPRLAGASLWAVQAEDHYLRLHTSAGEDLILMRLADALVELEGLEGARTHRSWWVARAAVTGVERAEGRATLTLPGDLKAPVSRAYVKPLREAGWF